MAGRAGRRLSPLTSLGGACPLVVVAAVTWLLPRVAGHGRLLDPPSRSSMWREGYSTPRNYDDNQLYCGGFGVQWTRYGGKCGLCGDPWPGPRDNEPGGKYAAGVIGRHYDQGHVITAHVQLTANHKGYFEFRLCEHNDVKTNITQACLDRHVLVDDDTGRTRYVVPTNEAGRVQELYVKLRLPPEVTCSACVLQWKYNAGNSWGVDPESGQGCMGCGPQEQFYGCADVAIGQGQSQGQTEVPGQGQTETGGGGRVEVPPGSQFPWYFQKPDPEWHYGIAYMFGTFGDTGSISAASTPSLPAAALAFVVMVRAAIVVMATG